MGWIRIWHRLRIGGGLVGGGMMFAAGVSPLDASSNLSAWAEVLGVKSVPVWLSSPRADTLVLWAGAAIFFAWAIKQAWIIFGIREMALSGSGKPSTPAADDQPWPDFEKWDQHDRFQLYEAACLWFNLEPRLPMPPQAKAKCAEWVEQIYEGKLPSNTDSVRESIEFAFEATGSRERTSVTPHNTLSRESFAILAEDEGVQPLFLFPHKRGE